MASITSRENALPGNPPGEWDVAGSGDPTLQGFATDISYNQGQTASFKVDDKGGPSEAYHVDVYRLGYYQGNGARKVATIPTARSATTAQPAPLTDPATGLVDGGNWSVSATWAIPADAASGVYIARLVRDDGLGASHIPFVVRSDNTPSQVLFKTSDATWQAYNSYGGSDLYKGDPSIGGKATKVSYNRPLILRGENNNSFFSDEYPMVRWLEANGYDVSYTTQVDTARNGGQISAAAPGTGAPLHKVFLSVGHDEYWSAEERAAVEAARGQGVNLAFFSGNSVFWKTRWANSIDASGTPFRTLVCYKETEAAAKVDPSPTWTGAWADPNTFGAVDGNRPQNALTGTAFGVNGTRSDPITISAAEGKLRLWRNTAAASLALGTSYLTPNGTLGYEFDITPDNGSQPAGLIALSTTAVADAALLLDYGTYFAHYNANATHHLSMYRASGGALVFGAGTAQWSWGLDSVHDGPFTRTDSVMRQGTVNLLADMGVQPDTLQADLTPAAASADREAPSAAITAPAAGAVLESRPYTVTGTAVDAGGGRVGGVEVSVDGGTTWHPASGRESWSYTWTPAAVGPVRIAARAVDDSGNLGAAATASVTVTLSSGPAGLWDDAAVPVVAAYAGTATGGLDVGVRFRSDSDGSVSAVRFYKGAQNTGSHVGSLWDAYGNRLATVTFAGETASGWQTASFATPVPIRAGATYTASYHLDSRNYALDGTYFRSPRDAPPLHALGGVFTTLAGAFPNQSPRFYSNYWVDVVFNASVTKPSMAATSATLWDAAAVPSTPWVNDPAAAEVGVKFRSDAAGYVTGVRFYKGGRNTGPHTGSLWSATGQLLAQAAFSGESASGAWQTVTFATPVAVSAGVTYVASYHTATGYAADPGYFASSGRDSGVLHAPGSGASGGNGVYAYGPGGFPTQSYNASNYWVDVAFATA